MHALQEAAAAIWGALVADPRKALDTYFDVIVGDLIKARIRAGRETAAPNQASDDVSPTPAAAGAGIAAVPQPRVRGHGAGGRPPGPPLGAGARPSLSRETTRAVNFRSRNRSEAAPTLILGTRPAPPQVKPHFSELWAMSFRVLDDINATVRTAAQSLSRALVSLTVRLCDSAATAPADAADCVAAALPFLLTTGVPSAAAEVRAVSVRTVAQLAEKASPAALAAHLPAVIGAMLEALAGLEDSRRVFYLFSFLFSSLFSRLARVPPDPAGAAALCVVVLPLIRLCENEKRAKK